MRIVNGLVGNLLPDEMTVPDGVQPGGTDNSCYLTMSSGTNYVYVKVLVDSGKFDGANVYSVDSQEDPDSSYLYLLIGIVTYGQPAGLTISQYVSGSQSALAVAASDGTLTGFFSSISQS